MPGNQTLPKNIGPATLKPGQSVSSIFDVLSPKGPHVLAADTALPFGFVWAKNETQSFYCMSKHHPKRPDSAQAPKPQHDPPTTCR